MIDWRTEERLRSTGVRHLTYGGMRIRDYLRDHYFPAHDSLTVPTLLKELGFSPGDYDRLAGCVKNVAEELGWKKIKNGWRVSYVRQEL